MIYLDHAASSPCLPSVVESMLPYFTSNVGNASSIDHIAGVEARAAVEAARVAVADLFNARAEDVIFTSGATESNNLALSVARNVVTTAVEHPSVLEAAGRPDREVDYVGVDQYGRPKIDEIRKALEARPDCLLAVIGTNNETGTETDISTVQNTAADCNALLHIDGTQLVGTREISLKDEKNVSVSISAHKIGGPKGVGALVVGSRYRRLMRPILRGGGHERGFRSGTLNVPGIVGLGAAVRSLHSLRARRKKLSELSELFFQRLVHENGCQAERTVPAEVASPHILNLRFLRANARAVSAAVRNEICLSLGSACATNKSEPSHVLIAMGLTRAEAVRTVRISFAPDLLTTEVAQAADLIAAAVLQLERYAIA